jgi:diketogulonate reductase-like aldo/keto reductase
MEKLLATGKVKAIGVANYSLRYLKELLPEATVVPAVNQIENHPSLPQQEIVDFCHEKGIHVTAYSPLGSTGSPMMKEPAVIKVAESKGVTPACVLLSYHSESLPGANLRRYIVLTRLGKLLEETLCFRNQSPLKE